MLLAHIVEVETLVVDWNLYDIEEALEISITVEIVEKFVEGHRRELRKRVESVDEKTNVSVARLGRGERVVRSNLELTRLINLGRPVHHIVVLVDSWFDRGSLLANLGSFLLQGNNLK
jgi:hypothetical protein